MFRINGAKYGEPDPDFELDYIDERDITLDRVINDPGDTFNYGYDFGDGWQHRLRIEEILPVSNPNPQCLAGKRNCPPEDCGGIWGYQDFLTAIGDPTHEHHNQMIEWIDGNFDPEKFDPEETNDILQDLPQPI